MFCCKIASPSAGNVVLYQRSSAKQSISDLIEQIVADKRINNADEILIRQPVTLNQELTSASMALTSRGGILRARGRPVTILGSYKFQHWLSPNINTDTSSVASNLNNQNLKELCHAELKAYAEQTGAILPVLPSGLYRTPSGHFVRRFLRAGNAQKSQGVLDAYFFWLLPFLKNRNAIATDTWSISSIALNACRRLPQYTKDSSAAEDIQFTILPNKNEYGADGSVGELIRSIRDRNALFILSARHSGDLLRRVEEEYEKEEFKSGNICAVSIYDLNEQPLPSSLCNLHTEYKDGFEKLDPPALGDPLIEIDSYSFFPSNYVNLPLRAQAKHGLQAKTFLAQHATQTHGAEALVHSHYADPTGNGDRHYAYWIDTQLLFSSNGFQNELVKKLLALSPPPELIVYPDHPAAFQLADIAKSVFTGVRSIMASDLLLISEEQTNVLLKSRALLVLVDAYVTGRQLLAYHAQLRKIEYPGAVHYRIGVARPSELADWEIRKTRLKTNLLDSTDHHKNSAEAIETICLPEWGKDECPWCAEADIYALFIRRVQKSLPTAARMRQTELFGLAGSAQPFLGQLNNPIGKGSIFCPDKSSALSACFAVASTFQNMRQNNSKQSFLGQRQYPVASIFNSTQFLPGEFDDNALIAAFFRNLTAGELCCSSREEEKKRGERHVSEIRRLKAEGKLIPGLVQELCLAWHQRKLPHFIGSHLRDFLEGEEKDFWSEVHAWRQPD